MPGQRVPSVTLICEKCGQPFHPWKKNKPSRFCSRACAPRGRPPKMPDATCEQCGVLFRPGQRYQRFCCRACYVASGGRTILGSGYAVIYKKGHPRASKSGQVLEHIIVMEEKLGRPVTVDETIHHINGIKDDNRPENLQLHQRRHGNSVRMRCVDCGSHNVESIPI